VSEFGPYCWNRRSASSEERPYLKKSPAFQHFIGMQDMPFNVMQNFFCFLECDFFDRHDINCYRGLFFRK